jgi:hypothetical protein
MAFFAGGEWCCGGQIRFGRAGKKIAGLATGYQQDLI